MKKVKINYISKKFDNGGFLIDGKELDILSVKIKKSLI